MEHRDESGPLAAAAFYLYFCCFRFKVVRAKKGRTEVCGKLAAIVLCSLKEKISRETVVGSRGRVKRARRPQKRPGDDYLACEQHSGEYVLGKKTWRWWFNSRNELQ